MRVSLFFACGRRQVTWIPLMSDLSSETSTVVNIAPQRGYSRQHEKLEYAAVDWVLSYWHSSWAKSHFVHIIHTTDSWSCNSFEMTHHFCYNHCNRHKYLTLNALPLTLIFLKGLWATDTSSISLMVNAYTALQVFPIHAWLHRCAFLCFNWFCFTEWPGASLLATNIWILHISCSPG